jgi:hypothetical protein
MNTRELLLEATYDLGHSIDEIYKNEIAPIIIKLKAGKRVKLQKADITSYIKHIVDKVSAEKDYKLELYFRETEKPQAQWIKSSPEGWRNGIIETNLEIDFIKSSNLSAIKKEIVFKLSHEITHFIDTIRTRNKVESPYENVDYKFYKSSMESNAFIHEIKSYIKANPKKWNKIDSIEKFGDLLLEFIPSLHILYNDNPNGYKNIERKYLKRLARENLLPSRMLTKSF